MKFYVSRLVAIIAGLRIRLIDRCRQCLGTGLFVLCAMSAVANAEKPTVILVVGAGGAAEYESEFKQWAERWQSACKSIDLPLTTIGLDDGQADDRDRIKEVIASTKGPSRLWIVLIGHGTSSRDTAKFNLRGPDVSAKEFSEWLDGVSSPMALVNCSSSSGPFLKRLSKPGRVIVTATKSGAEQNYARFGKFFAQAVSDDSADLDHDEQVSLLEAYLTASKRTQKFYSDESRLATEHALLDDNGDGLGTPADFFQGVRAVKKAKGDAKPDGRQAHQFVLVASERENALTPEQLKRRDELEENIEQLRTQKRFRDEAKYYAELETLLVELARIYR